MNSLVVPATLPESQSRIVSDRVSSVGQNGSLGRPFLSVTMSLSQVQIIHSLAEALTWLEKELAWNVKPGSIRHLTGRIGELYTAMLTRGQMAPGVMQKGYDVVSAEGQHISVKTVTTSNHVSFNKNTIHLANHFVILRINIIENEASIEELFRGSEIDLRHSCNETANKLVYMIRKLPSVPTAVEGLEIIGVAQIANRRIIQYENSSIAVETNDRRELIVYPVLLQVAAELGVSPLNGNGNKMNTRQLGAAIIATRGHPNVSVGPTAPLPIAVA